MANIERIIELRDTGLTQRQIADELGTTQSAISRSLATRRTLQSDHGPLRRAADAMLAAEELPEFTKTLILELCGAMDGLLADGSPNAMRALPGVVEQLRATVESLQSL